MGIEVGLGLISANEIVGGVTDDVTAIEIADTAGPIGLADGRLEVVVATGIADEGTVCVVAEKEEEWRDRRERRREILTSLASGFTSSDR
ncbi:hypothetical protein L6452_36529 [Arctium lappa]|uniref:Uncharacterized protein n=1 Tax=Arctium lappa TaxID=4217 RepID=A0ACB8Y8V3_ARCLA|nr:hypothetical protein L6452_36529 [Arctium lappa]